MRIIGITQKHGLRKIRITGGEPFARRGLINFLTQIRTQYQDLRLCITTNASLLGPYLNILSDLGLASFNISLDSFKRTDFERLTGRDELHKVLDNIHGLLARGQKVKINAVALRGITDKQLNHFIAIIRQYPLDLRFIEFMPMGANTAWNKDKFISTAELINTVSRTVQLTPVVDNDVLAGPAQIYKVENCPGRLGFISAISNHFCSVCNRLRITSQGGLRTCLFSDQEYQLAKLLRNQKIGDIHIEKVILAAMRQKPFGKDLLALSRGGYVAETQMIGIGG